MTAMPFRPAKFLLPQEEKLALWPCVACDQFSSQPSYWDAAADARTGVESALHIVYPEALLLRETAPERAARVGKIAREMESYTENGLFRAVEGFILVERETTDGNRIGLLGMIDLEQYDFAPGTRSAIRPTEETVPERVPPRCAVRKNACLELSHVLLLADDAERTLIEPVYAARKSLLPLYDMDLPENGGHIRGWLLDTSAPAASGADSAASTPAEWVFAALSHLVEASTAPGSGRDGVVLAVGDGNHSLAAARQHWLSVRRTLPVEQQACHPARFAMAEVVNLHSPAQNFKAIHRALFGAWEEFPRWIERFFAQNGCRMEACGSSCEGACKSACKDSCGASGGASCGASGSGESASGFSFSMNDVPYRLFWAESGAALSGNAPLTLLQRGIDLFVQAHADVSVDYIHGDAALRALAQRGALPLALPAMDKSALFAEIARGPLARKTFSMGEAPDKRFYLECREIR